MQSQRLIGCPHCRAAVSIAARFCPRCGGRVDPNERAVAAWGATALPETREQRRARLDREIDAKVAQQAGPNGMVGSAWFFLILIGTVCIVGGGGEGALILGITMLLCGLVVFVLDVRHHVHIRERAEREILRAQPPNRSGA